MLCVECGKEGMTSKKEAYSYKESGLPGITLVGVEVSRCKHCGNYEVAIPKIQTLHKMIAETIARKPWSLTHDEARFLRKFTGLSGAAFAGYIGKAPETVSRWETGKQSMPVVAERVLRCMVLSGWSAGDYSVESIEEKKKPAPVKVRAVQNKDRSWAVPELCAV